MRTLLACIAIAWCAAAGAAPGHREPRMTVQPFPLTRVRLSSGPCRAALEADHRYLRSLDPERLLHSFRLNAGLPSSAKPLGGWEAPDIEVRGHFVGHYVSACAMMYQATGDPEMKARVDRVVAGWAECQKALGGGYLSAFPATFWDRLEKMDRPPWAPFYTIHKIMAGLYDAYTRCGSRQALEVLKGMAAYFKHRADRLTTWEMDRLLNVEFGGIAETLHDLYGVTHDPAHLELACRFDQPAFLGPLALEHDNLSRIHANTQIPKICAAARRYELTGDERYRTIVRYFWDRVVHHRAYATGGCTDGEAWGDPDHLAGALSPTNQECCTTYNMLRVTRYLFRWTGDPAYADYYERAFLNGILGTQRADDGMLMYYVPLATGYAKGFGTPEGAFWCCYGTGIESFAKLADSIYFHYDRALYVNLFISSTVDWEEKGLRVEQSTGFPDEPSTSIVVRAGRPVRAALKVRVPAWATGARAMLNGNPAGTPRPGAYLEIEREWRDGDRVELTLPMTLRAVPMPDDPDMVAFACGPIVLAGIVGPGVAPASQESENPVAPLRVQGGVRLLTGDARRPATVLEPVAGRPLTFRAVGQEEATTFVPLERVTNEPYGVYWIVAAEGSARHRAMMDAREAKRRRDARRVDEVLPDVAESERAHGLKGEKTASGPWAGSHWRHAEPGGWWSWDLAVPPDTPVTLVCTYWGDDNPPRTFDIVVDGAVVGTQSLNHDRPGQLFDVEYPLPPELTRGKSRVTVRFVPHAGCMAGGVFGCAVLRPEPPK